MVKTEKRKMERYLFNTKYSTLVPFEATVRGERLTVTTFRKTIAPTIITTTNMKQIKRLRTIQ